MYSNYYISLYEYLHVAHVVMFSYYMTSSILLMFELRH